MHNKLRTAQDSEAHTTGNIQTSYTLERAGNK